MMGSVILAPGPERLSTVGAAGLGGFLLLVIVFTMGVAAGFLVNRNVFGFAGRSETEKAFNAILVTDGLMAFANIVIIALGSDSTLDRLIRVFTNGFVEMSVLTIIATYIIMRVHGSDPLTEYANRVRLQPFAGEGSERGEYGDPYAPAPDYPASDGSGERITLNEALAGLDDYAQASYHEAAHAADTVETGYDDPTDELFMVSNDNAAKNNAGQA